MRKVKLFPVTKGERYHLPVEVTGDGVGGWQYIPAPKSGYFISLGEHGVIIPEKEFLELAELELEEGE